MNNREKIWQMQKKLYTFAVVNTDCYGVMGTQWYWRNFSRAEGVFDKSLG